MTMVEHDLNEGVEVHVCDECRSWLVNGDTTSIDLMDEDEAALRRAVVERPDDGRYVVDPDDPGSFAGWRCDRCDVAGSELYRARYYS